MRKFLFGLILALSISPAAAQNPTCPTRPFGDSSNACASTAFVQAAIIGKCTTSGAFEVGTGASSQCSTVAGSLAIVNGAFAVSASDGTGFFAFTGQTPNPTAAGTNAFRLFADSTGRVSWIRSDGFVRTFDSTLTGNRVWTFPDLAGTVVMFSQLIASNITNTPAGGISATDVQSALNELDTEKAAIASLASVAFSGAYADLSGPVATVATVAGGSTAGSTLTLESTSGAGTTDRVMIKTASQVERVRVDTTGFVNIGPALTPDSLLTVNANTGNTVAPSANTIVHFIGGDGINLSTNWDSFGGQVVFNPRRANGTLAAKTGMVANDVMFNFAVQGWNTNAFSSAVGILFTATETWSTTATGAEMTFRTTANGTTPLLSNMRLQGSGGLTLGSAILATDPGAGAFLAAASIKATTTLATSPVTVANLPTCNAALNGGRTYVTNGLSSLTAGIGAVVAGGGANNVPVNCDGTNWRYGKLREKVYALGKVLMQLFSFNSALAGTL